MYAIRSYYEIEPITEDVDGRPHLTQLGNSRGVRDFYPFPKCRRNVNGVPLLQGELVERSTENSLGAHQDVVRIVQEGTGAVCKSDEAPELHIIDMQSVEYGGSEHRQQTDVLSDVRAAVRLSPEDLVPGHETWEGQFGIPT